MLWTFLNINLQTVNKQNQGICNSYTLNIPRRSESFNLTRLRSTRINKPHAIKSENARRFHTSFIHRGPPGARKVAPAVNWTPAHAMAPSPEFIKGNPGNWGDGRQDYRYRMAITPGLLSQGNYNIKALVSRKLTYRGICEAMPFISKNLKSYIQPFLKVSLNIPSKVTSSFLSHKTCNSKPFVSLNL